jgi:hypothetical protein
MRALGDAAGSVAGKCGKAKEKAAAELLRRRRGAAERNEQL